MFNLSTFYIFLKIVYYTAPTLQPTRRSQICLYYYSKTFCLDENLAVRPSWKLSFAGASFWVIPVRPIPFFVVSGHSFRFFSFLAEFFFDYDLRDHNYGLGAINFASRGIDLAFKVIILASRRSFWHLRPYFSD